jgi:cytochrome c-type biogenesis protein CcmH/NrfG
LFVRKTVKRSKLQKAVFIVLTVLIAVGLVVPLASLLQKQPDGGAQDTAPVQQSLQDRLSELETKAMENPGDKTVLMDLADTYRYMGKPDQAIKTYEQALALDPNDSAVSVDIATVYYLSNKNDQAIAQLQGVLKREPDNKDAHLLMGFVLGGGKKDYAGGIQEMEKFISLAKEGPDVEKARQVIDEWKSAQAQK